MCFTPSVSLEGKCNCSTLVRNHMESNWSLVKHRRVICQSAKPQWGNITIYIEMLDKLNDDISCTLMWKDSNSNWYKISSINKKNQYLWLVYYSRSEKYNYFDCLFSSVIFPPCLFKSSIFYFGPFLNKYCIYFLKLMDKSSSYSLICYVSYPSVNCS